MKFFLIFSFLFSCGYAVFIEDHVLTQIERSEIIENPFPALVIDNFFPEAYYLEALDYISELTPIRPDVRRFKVPISPESESFSAYSKEGQNFWSEFLLFMNKIVKPAIVNKFGELYLRKFDLPCYLPYMDYIEKNFKAFCDAKTDSICFDSSGYKIEPHVDQVFVYLKVLVYFAEDQSMSSYGTYMMDCPKKSHGVSYLKEKDLSLVKGEELIEFKPNRLVVMMQTPISWHEVRPLHFQDFRKTYNGNIYVDFDFLQMIDDDPSIGEMAKRNRN